MAGRSTGPVTSPQDEEWHHEPGIGPYRYILRGKQVWAQVYRDPQTGEAGQIERAETIVQALRAAHRKESA
jgi:hypothetical protein